MNAASKILDPTGPDAATIAVGSDRYPATIVARTAKTIKVQGDRATRIDGNGLSESQTWLFERDYDAPILTYTLRRNGRWVRQGSPQNARGAGLGLGHRSRHDDPHF